MELQDVGGGAAAGGNSGGTSRVKLVLNGRWMTALIGDTMGAGVLV